MTFKEMFYKERRWYKRIFIMDFYHNAKLFGNKNWTISKTASYFDVSIGQVSENIKLAKAMRSSNELESFSRNKALKVLRTR